MKHLVIKNLGPIKDADIELNRFNVFVGPQSSGKSTIAKVMSTCEWVEKEVTTSLNENAIEDGASFRGLMESFHKMEGYFNVATATRIEYETDIVRIEYLGDVLKISLKNEQEYKRQKISYIPAERNMVTLPELDGFEFKNTNLKSFLFDWWRARDFHTPENKLNILGLGFQYYYDKKRSAKRDRIQHVNGVTYDIPLSDSSSGLQSVTPLFVMLEYYTNQYFTEYNAKSSFVDEDKQNQTRFALVSKYILQILKSDFKEEDVPALLDRFNADFRQQDPKAREMYRRYAGALERLTTPIKITFIIEEPEQNLFPETQMALLRYIIKVCLTERSHACTLTTHSPYILYALNNCMLAWLVKDKVDDGMRNSNVALQSAINPKEVSVWSIKDGVICNEEGERQRTLQDARGLVRKNYFNMIMKDVMNGFNELLSYDD